MTLERFKAQLKHSDTQEAKILLRLIEEMEFQLEFQQMLSEQGYLQLPRGQKLFSAHRLWMVLCDEVEDAKIDHCLSCRPGYCCPVCPTREKM